jgi:hypothetical protein
VRGVPRGVTPRALVDWLAPAQCHGGVRGVHFDLDAVGGRGGLGGGRRGGLAG